MPRLLALILLLVTSLSFAAQPLRVGVSADYPPLHYTQGGKIVGVEADNARAVGRILGREVALVKLPFEELYSALEAEQIDVVMSGISATGQRSEKVDFAEPYLEIGQMAIMHRDKIGRLSQPWAIFQPGIRVGVEPGTTGDEFARRELSEAQITHFDNPEAAFQGLRDDRIDLYVHDAPTSWLLAQGSENSDLISLYRPLTKEHLAWVVRKGNNELLRDLNDALLQMRRNGTLSYILNRWIPVQVEVQ